MATKDGSKDGKDGNDKDKKKKESAKKCSLCPVNGRDKPNDLPPNRDACFECVAKHGIHAKWLGNGQFLVQTYLNGKQVPISFIFDRDDEGFVEIWDNDPRWKKDPKNQTIGMMIINTQARRDRDVVVSLHLIGSEETDVEDVTILREKREFKPAAFVIGKHPMRTLFGRKQR